MLADLRGWSRFVGLQIPYSLIERTPERDLLPMARALDIAVTTWGGLGGGVLTGKYEKGKPGPEGGRLTDSPWFERMLTDRNFAIAQAVKDVAEALGCTASQAAIAWVLAQRRRAGIIPIVGARTLAQIQDNLGALPVALPDAARARLDEASAIPPGFPHDFLLETRPFVFGETFAQIDNHRS
jgi:aryl-alcohol dehydrogenase-like predicted oxidoreductase